MTDRFFALTTFMNLRRAATRAARGHRGSPEVAGFLLELEANVLQLQRALRAGAWCPGPIQTFRIRDPKPRMISASPFPDRLVHHVVCGAMEARLEALADTDSFACRPGRGSHAAVARAQALARSHPWFVKLDVRHYFETVPLRPLRLRLRAFVEQDPHLLDVLDRILDNATTAPGRGLPIGSLCSQHLANFYLGRLDQWARRTLRVGGLVRYMDDVLWFGAEREEVRQWPTAAEGYLATQLGLELKHEATVVAPVSVGVPFLGFRIWPRLRRLDGARLRRFRRRLRLLGALPEAEAQRRGGAVLAWASFADTLRLRRAGQAR